MRKCRNFDKDCAITCGYVGILIKIEPFTCGNVGIFDKECAKFEQNAPSAASDCAITCGNVGILIKNAQNLNKMRQVPQVIAQKK